MRILLAIIFLFSQSFAQVKRVATGGQTSNLAGAPTNYVKNFGAEDNINNVTYVINLLRNDGAFGTPLFGNGDFLIQSTAASEYVKFDTHTYDEGVKGNCMASFWIKGDATSFKAYVEDGSSNKITTDLTLSNYTDSTPVQMSYTCTAGAKPVIEATAASAGFIQVDNVTSGLATNYNSVNQASFYGGMTQPGAANCSYTQSTSSGLTNWVGLSTAGSCASTWTASGAVTAPGATDYRPTLNNMPEGEYLIIITGVFYGSGTGDAYYRISDGTNNSAMIALTNVTNSAVNNTVVGRISYTTSGNRTFQIQSSDNFTGSSGVSNDTVGRQLTWSFYRFPTQSQQVVSQASQGWFVAANIAGANPSLGTSNQSSYVEITNASLTMTPLTNSQPVGIMCSGTNAAATPTTGTSVCSSGSEGIGASFSVPDVGWYNVCAEYGHYNNNGAGGSLDVTFQMVETATNSQTILQQGNARIPSTNLTANTANNRAFNLCSPFYFSSVGTKAVRLMYEQVVGGTVADNIIVADQLASLGQRDILITVEIL